MHRPLRVGPQLEENLRFLVFRQDKRAIGNSSLYLKHQILHNLQIRINQVYIEPLAVGGRFERLIIQHPTGKPDGIARRINIAIGKKMDLLGCIARLKPHLLLKKPGKSRGQTGRLLGCGKRREDARSSNKKSKRKTQ